MVAGEERGRAGARRTTRRVAARVVGWVLLMGCVLLLPMLSPPPVHGQDNTDSGERRVAPAQDRVAMFSTIVVSRDHPAADVACMFCTVRVEEDVRGDVAVMFGTVSVEEGARISGDVALLFSTLNVAEGARVNGDVTTAFSTTAIAPGAHVRGARAMLASGLGVAVLLGAVLLGAGVVWLLVWGLRRALSY